MQADLDVEIGERLLQIALQPPQLAAVAIGLLVRRVKADGFVQIGNGAIVVAAHLSRSARGCCRRCDCFRIETNGFIEVRNRLVEFPQLSPQRATGGKRRRIFRVEADAASRSAMAFGWFSLEHPRRRPVTQSDQILRIQSQRLIEIDDGPIEVVLGSPSGAARGIDRGERRRGKPRLSASNFVQPAILRSQSAL